MTKALELFSICSLVLFLFTTEGHGGHISDDDFVKIEADCFQMGDQFGDGLADELPVHLVCLSTFYISKYEVTQEQWQYVMGDNPSHDQGNPMYPVDVVSWTDVDTFIKKLNAKTDGNYRLPTEAEWEYGCRAGGKNFKYGTADGTSSEHLLSHTDSAEQGQGVNTHQEYTHQPKQLLHIDKDR